MTIKSLTDSADVMNLQLQLIVIVHVLLSLCMKAKGFFCAARRLQCVYGINGVFLQRPSQTGCLVQSHLTTFTIICYNNIARLVISILLQGWAPTMHASCRY